MIILTLSTLNVVLLCAQRENFFEGGGTYSREGGIYQGGQVAKGGGEV